MAFGLPLTRRLVGQNGTVVCDGHRPPLQGSWEGSPCDLPPALRITQGGSQVAAQTPGVGKFGGSLPKAAATLERPRALPRREIWRLTAPALSGNMRPSMSGSENQFSFFPAATLKGWRGKRGSFRRPSVQVK